MKSVDLKIPLGNLIFIDGFEGVQVCSEVRIMNREIGVHHY